MKKPPPLLRLENKKYCIRNWEFGDKAALLKYANNRKIWRNLRDLFPYPYLEEHADAWLSVVAGKDGVMDFAIASESETIGGIGLVPKDDVHRKSVELGYWLAEPFWGKGIMTSAVGNITSYAFDTLDIVRIYSTIFEWNHASMKVLEKVGFIREGHLRKSAFKDGHLIDQFVYALILQKAK